MVFAHFGFFNSALFMKRCFVSLNRTREVALMAHSMTLRSPVRVTICQDGLETRDSNFVNEETAP